MWNIRVTIILIVIGAFGAAPKRAGRIENPKKNGDHPN